MSDDLFAGIVERGSVREATSDAAWLDAMLMAESALAAAQSRLGQLPEVAAEDIARACADPQAYDLAELAALTPRGGNPVIPLVAMLRSSVDEQHAGHVHQGATSQDILDTAAMLLARRAITIVRADLEQAQASLLDLSARHRDLAMIGRTLMQAARPLTFGQKVAAWTRGLDGCDARLRLTAESLPVQIGGPVGTSAYDLDGLTEAYAEETELRAQPAWHTIRLPIADLAACLAATSGVVDKVARDVILMAQTEVGEVREFAPGRGGSSSMAHKNNPVAAISASASARRAPALAGHLYASMAHEHERAAGAWHAEWVPLVDLLRTTGSAVAWLADSLANLEVDEDAVRTNLARAERPQP